ncbi:hypothetical protein Tsubulata_023654, partial [Turnera subulata]
IMTHEWTRITEPVAGRLSYKPPINDMTAQDLCIPCIAFATYSVSRWYLIGDFDVPTHPRFSPEALNWQFVEGMVGWVSQVMLLLKISLLPLGGREASLLDMVAYAGYTFTG